jgi:uncharacterized repeat protein (TIGR03843 family)
VLATGRVELRGRIPWSSNATFLVEVCTGDGELVPAIYKPAKGERPLWDFPRGLWQREVAAYELAEGLGWHTVPPTVGRDDGPFGPGSLQYWVDALEEEHYFTLLEAPEHRATLQRVAAFDIVTNNADRKGGHLLLDTAGRVWAIDHGLCFHAEPKLRTVIWDFAGEEVGADVLDALAPLAKGEVRPAVARYLDEVEVNALVRRARTLCRRGRFPAPSGRWPYPWPLV